MHKVTGSCHCGNIRVEMDLTRAPGTIRPRACDCDFCRKHRAAYISDAHGTLLIRIEEEHESGRYFQGDGLAEFLVCRRCGVLVGVLYRLEDRLYAAINVNATDRPAEFGIEQPVSPKKLSGTEKSQRWQEIWFSTVNLVGHQTSQTRV
jgi:hypothetical protein